MNEEEDVKDQPGDAAPEPSDADAADDQDVADGESDVDDSKSDDADGSADAAEKEDDAVAILGKSDYEKIKDDPIKLAKALNRAATEKFQQASKIRKAYEPYTGFFNALETNPRAAINALARKVGMRTDYQESDGRGEAVADLGTKVATIVTKALGQDFEDLAPRLAPAILEASKAVVAEQMKDHSAKVDQVISDSAQRESELAMKSFSSKHPDWKRHEDAMLELSKRLLPGENMTQEEYLEVLYFNVTRDQAIGSATRKAVDRMSRSAKGASGKDAGMPDSQVSRRSDKPLSFQEAADMARKGVRVE